MKKKLLALVLVLVMVLGLAACGDKDKGDPNEIVIGDYTAYYTHSEFVTDYDGDDAIAIYFDFTNNSDEDASFLWSMYYTLTQNGAEMEQATVFLSEDSFDTLFDTAMEDVAPGEMLEVALTYKLADKEAPIEIEFTDLFDSEKEHLTIDLATVGAAGNAAPTEETENGDAVTYKAISMNAGGEELGEDMLALMGDCYVTFNSDGTAVMDMFDDVFMLDYDGEQFTMMGVPFSDYTIEGDTLTFDMEGAEVVLTVTEEAYEVPAVTMGVEDAEEEKVGYAFSSDIATTYAGDWHGMAEFYECTGDYSDEDELQCEIIARLVFDEEGYCTPYVRLCLSQSEDENFVIESLSYDEEYDCMLINGTLHEKPLDPVESFIELEDGVLYIGAEYDDGSGDVFKLLGCLRRLDDQWDYENDYPYLPQEGVDFYMGKSFEEIVELYGYDTSLIPELSGNVVSDVQEEEPAAAAAEGIVELQQLKDWKAWLDEVNSYENEYYTPTYEECVEAMDGIEPAPYKVDDWDDEYQKYKWTTADGKDHIIMTAKPTDDGSGWRYHSISWSSGVNG
ncbi:MAG: DUF5067 domain-containing protein [Oscillospiraceae bacterium]|nr:DUF5067 domain-containing protein [Oscillospiraceae bacterium]